MVYEPSEIAEFRQRLLLSPGERQEVDYKASAPFVDGDEFSLKLVRHIQGMANAGGGWLVIGYREKEGVWEPDPQHTDAVCESYEPTDLSKKLNSYVARGQQLRIDVHFEQAGVSAVRYPMISTRGFDRTPFVCRSEKSAVDTGELILEQGVAYLRRPGAETSKVSTPEDWEDLITRAVRRRRDEFLDEFSELLDRLTSPSSSKPVPLELIRDWADQSREAAFRPGG